MVIFLLLNPATQAIHYVLLQKRVRGSSQVSKREKALAFYGFRVFETLWNPNHEFFKMSSLKKQYEIMQCCIFHIFL